MELPNTAVVPAPQADQRPSTQAVAPAVRPVEMLSPEEVMKALVEVFERHLLPPIYKKAKTGYDSKREQYWILLPEMSEGDFDILVRGLHEKLETNVSAAVSEQGDEGRRFLLLIDAVQLTTKEMEDECRHRQEEWAGLRRKCSTFVAGIWS